MSFRLWHIIPIITVLSLLLFGKSLTYYFFQDDWFVLKSTSDFLEFFKFRTDIIYWRPIGMFTFFSLAKSIFGLNPFGFHLIAFIVHILNGFLIAHLAFKLFNNFKAATITSVLYTSASFHFMTLSWLSLTWNAMGTAFFLLAFNFYLNFRKNLNLLNFVYILIFYFFALASSELAIIFPIFVVVFELFFTRDKAKTALPKIFPLVGILLLANLTYLFARLILYPVPARGEYAININWLSLPNLFWYVAWLFNIPEVFKYHFGLLPPSFSKDPTFIAPVKPYMIQLAIFFSVFLSSLIYFVFKKSSEKTNYLIFALLTLLIGLLPVLILPQHTFPYYLSIPSIGFFLFIGFVSQKLPQQAILILLISWFLTSFFAISFTRKTHWTSGESAISKETILKIKSALPNVAQGSTIVLYPATDQLRQSLMDQNALQVIFNDESIKTVYNQNITVEEENINTFYIDLR